MPVLRIPTPLRSYTSGKSEIQVSGSNISEALTDLTAQYPPIKPHLFNDSGELRPFVNLFVAIALSSSRVVEFVSAWQVAKCGDQTLKFDDVGIFSA